MHFQAEVTKILIVLIFLFKNDILIRKIYQPIKNCWANCSGFSVLIANLFGRDFFFLKFSQLFFPVSAKESINVSDSETTLTEWNERLATKTCIDIQICACLNM